jgi:NTE family protein
MTEAALSPVHDTDDRPPEAGIALCLSGGGYRAMLFHVGCLWRLNDARMLGRLDRISSVSGGSITAAVLGMNWGQLSLTPETASPNFQRLLVDPIRTMASTTVDEGAIFGGIFLPGSVSDHVADKYKAILFANKTLQDLPDKPRFVINATNVQSGVLMRMSKPYMRDFRVGKISNPKLPLARAVAASSAFPPVLSPCEIKLSDYGLVFDRGVDGEDLNLAPYTTDLVLADGGVYDNLGLETAWKRYDTILVSDGGAHYAAEPTPHHDWARHAYRVLDLIDSQVRALRSRQMATLFKSGARKGCYWGIRQPYPRTGQLPCPPEKSLALSQISTRLKAMDQQTQERLINWGFAICDSSLKTWFDPTLIPASTLPYPNSGI